MINRLYSLLTVDKPNTDQRYKKKTSVVWHTDRSKAIRDILVAKAESDIGYFASLVCYEVLATQYGEDILALDGNNTYAQLSASENTMSNKTHTAQQLAAVLPYLDQDIKDRLVAPTWIETVAAGCLQMLRESF